MVIERRIGASAEVIWTAWRHPDNLPRWWGPDGISCRTQRIALQSGGEWVFDMIGPDGTVYPNHHVYHRFEADHGIDYTLLSGKNGPAHAEASVRFTEADGQTTVALSMVFPTAAECQAVRDFGAEALGLQTLGKLAAFIGAD